MRAEVVKLGVVQTCMGEDKAGNVERVLGLARTAAGQGAQIICLPELFATRYFCQREDEAAFDLAEPVDGPTLSRVIELGRELGVTLLAGFFERRAAGLYHNSLAVVGPSGLLGVYRKMHIPDDPGFCEKYYFTPGDTGFMSVATPSAAVGPLICWDQWFPEAARLTALAGAEILAYPTAIGWLPSEKAQVGLDQCQAWQSVQRAHAITNGVFVVAANRTGFEPAPGTEGVEFWGHSFVYDPFGVLLAEAGEGDEVLVVECDLARIEAARRAWPFLRDRRIDAYGGLGRRFGDSA